MIARKEKICKGLDVTAFERSEDPLEIMTDFDHDELRGVEK